MLPRNYSDEDMIDFFQRANNLLENYLTNREETLTHREKNIAALQARCAELEMRGELLQKFVDNFFKERQKIRGIAMKALDSAITLGDDKIAEIALTILGNEYSKDFFRMMNKVGGVV